MAAIAVVLLLPNDEARIRRCFERLRKHATKEPGETPISMARDLTGLRALFTDPCTVEAPTVGVSGSLSRHEIVELATRFRFEVNVVVISVDGLTIDVADGNRATARFVGSAAGQLATGEPFGETHDVECVLTKVGGQWLLSECRVMDDIVDE